MKRKPVDYRHFFENVILLAKKVDSVLTEEIAKKAQENTKKELTKKDASKKKEVTKKVSKKVAKKVEEKVAKEVAKTVEKKAIKKPAKALKEILKVKVVKVKKHLEFYEKRLKVLDGNISKREKMLNKAIESKKPEKDIKFHRGKLSELYKMKENLLAYKWKKAQELKKLAN